MCFSVIHCASLVNLLIDEKYMERTVVCGTRNIINFCIEANSTLFYTSSTSVFPDVGGPYGEELAHLSGVKSGYGVTKIRAEEEIVSSNVEATILRLPSLHDPVDPNPNDIYERILFSIGCNKLVPSKLRFQMLDGKKASELLIVASIKAKTGFGILNFVTNNFCGFEQFKSPEYTNMNHLDWINSSLLNEAERRYVCENGSVLNADAVLQNERARVFWADIMNEPFSNLNAPIIGRAER